MSQVHTGRCHCGEVEFQVTLEHGFDGLIRCNCSICRRKGAIMMSVPLQALQITRGEAALTLYQWNTRTAKHYFCKHCGIYTHHQRRSDPTQCGFNIGCIDGIDPSDFDSVRVVDGASMSMQS